MRLFRYLNVLLVLIGASTIATVFILFNVVDSNYSIGSRFKSINTIARYEGELSDNASSHRSDIIETLCNLPNKKSIKCLRKSQKLFVPFDFVARKFDMNDAEESNDNSHNLAFSYSQLHSPTKAYNTSAEYLWFNKIDVEERARVKSISFIHSVPISSQWKASGHIYPIQVGQFGLSHLSKWTLAGGGTYSWPDVNSFVVRDKSKFVYHENKKIPLVNSTKTGFEFNLTEKAIYKTDYSQDKRYIIASLSTSSSFELIIDMMLRDPALASSNYIVRLIYRVNAHGSSSASGQVEESLETRVDSDDRINTVIYSINGLRTDDLKFVRNMCVDACKGLKLKCNKCLKPIGELREVKNDLKRSRLLVSLYYKLYQISLKGQGTIKDAYFTDQLHSPNLEVAKQAVNYLLKSQSKTTGGWPIHVTRNFDKHTRTYLKSPWYSAMSQGLAISLLSRFYAHFKDDKYITSAAKALDLFELTINNGGVRANFMNSTSLVWYEEYPTQPYSLYVLNGFLYSMFGIYDFISVCHSDDNSILLRSSLIQIYLEKAIILYKNGLESLSSMLGLYDTGMRSFYDLRHLSNGSRVGPNVARWDYHMLHVSQLSYLIEMIEAERFNVSRGSVDLGLLRTVRDRWRMYSVGVWNQNSQITTKNFYKQN